MGNNLYQLKEFDYIVPLAAKKHYNGDVSHTQFIEDEDFSLLRDYLLTSVRDEGSQLFQTLRLSSKAHWGEAIQLKNYVGLIELINGTQFEILPKIYDKNSEVTDAKQIKVLLLQMLSTLKDFPVLNLGSAAVALQNLSLYEIFIRLYLNRVLELTKVGLRSGYIETEESLPSFRGKLKVIDQIRFNHSHAERFFVVHDEYTLSRPENRIIKSTLDKLLLLTRDQENKVLARKLLVLFDGVPASPDYETDYRKISFDNSNIAYLGAVQWSMVFLRNKSFSIFGGENKGQSLLFPMDRIFERYVASQIKRLIRFHNEAYGTKYRFVSQEANKYLFDIPKSFAIRPDINITGQETIILDTKWKILSAAKERNNISQSDMYQMYAYSKRYNASKVFLLYPETPSTSSIVNRKYTSIDKTLNTTVSLHFLNLINISAYSRTGMKKTLVNDNSLYLFLKGLLETNPGTGQTIILA